MIDPRLPLPIQESLQQLAVDWGNAYAGRRPDGVECAYPDAVARAAERTPLSVVGGAMLVTALEPMRRTPSHQGEQVSEIRSGEWLTVLLEAGDWWLVAGEDDYVGWVRNWVLRRQSNEDRHAQLGRRLGRCRLVRSTLWASDHWASSPLWRGMPALAPAEGERRRRGQVLVELPHGACGWMAEDDLEALPTTASVAAALDAARSLLGTPYVWGGRSPGGLDCSAYVQGALQLAGFDLPRDCCQQVASGEAVDLDRARWQAGDLLFFGEPPGHVGLYDGRGGLLHCRAFARRDEVGNIPQLMGRLSHVRRLTMADVLRRQTLWQHPVRSLDSPS